MNMAPFLYGFPYDTHPFHMIQNHANGCVKQAYSQCLQTPREKLHPFMHELIHTRQQAYRLTPSRKAALPCQAAG